MRKLAGLASVLAALALGAGGSHAANLYFSFSNVIGNVNGTVTGEIMGLNPNGTSAPTDIVIDSYPSGLVSFGSYPTPVDVSQWSGYTGFDSNTFTLSNGNFVSGGFSIFSANGVDDQLYINSTCCGSVDTNFLDIGSNDQLYVWNDNGVGEGGITFSTTPFGGVPEPTTWALTLVGVGGLGAALRSRRRMAAAKA